MALPGAHEIANSFEFTGGTRTLVLLFVTEKFKTENPKAYAALSVAVDYAMAFIRGDPAGAAEIFSAATKSATPAASVPANRSMFLDSSVNTGSLGAAFDWAGRERLLLAHPSRKETLEFTSDDSAQQIAFRHRPSTICARRHPIARFALCLPCTLTAAPSTLTA